MARWSGPSRTSHRLPGADYTAPRAYFITVVTHERRPLLASRQDDSIVLNPSGNLVMQSWGELAARFPEVGSDVIVIMPDHFHGILWITAIDGIEPHSLGQIVRALKGATTHAIRRQIDPGFGWQSNYHDRILRTDGELEQARNYIRRNPSDLLAHPDDPYRLLFGTDDTAPDM